MSELTKAQEELERILEEIPASGSFESARLAKRASNLGERILQLHSHPDAVVDAESPNDKKPQPAKRD